jgi:pimeloyl-ACP methyl ester carboxylesterase
LNLSLARSFGLFFAAFSLLSCAAQDRTSALERLRPCISEEGPTDAYCGTLKVFENRETRQGRTIDLKIVLLPALSNEARSDPLFFLAGGPGQGAAQLARPLRDAFRRVQSDRDIVLVDQRGTGKSNPLNCTADNDSLQALNEPDEAGLARLRKCMEEYDADLRMYTTPIAMEDLEDVRVHLGYGQINLYGGSYGTRAALVYLRAHEANVRTVILDGVAPPDMRLPLFFGRDAQRSLDKLIHDCETDTACRTQYPNLADRARALLLRLDREPVRVRLTHPRTGIAEDVKVNAAFVANVLASALYVPLAGSLIPELIKRAEANDFQGLLALVSIGESTGQNMSAGMQLSVVCAEDFPRITPEDAKRESTGTMFAAHLLSSRMKACEFWPKGAVPASYYDPVVSSVPILVMSGDLDPVTPPTWGESVTQHLKNAKHVVFPGTGHGAISTGCGMRILHAFLDRGSLEGLDTSCLQALKRPPFFVTPAGPDPAGAQGPPK